MATKQVFSDGRVFVGANDLSGDANVLTAELDRAQLERTTLADKLNQVFQPGLRVARMGGRGFWDAGAEAGTTAKKVDDALFANLDLVDVPITFLVDDSAAGKPGFAMRAGTARYRPGPGQHGALIPFELAMEMSTPPFLRGLSLFVGRVQADGQGAAINLGAVGAAQKLYAVLHVFGKGQLGETLDVKIQSDDAQGFATPTDRIVFGQKSTFAYEWASLAGPIADTWYRVSHDLSIAALSFDYAVLAAIQ